MFLMAAAAAATVAFGPPKVVSTYEQRADFGFRFGYVDGALGALKRPRHYWLYASATSSRECRGTPNTQGAYRLITADDDPTEITRVPCEALIATESRDHKERDKKGGPLTGPFDRDYVGGGPVLKVRGPDGKRDLVLMTYHAEYQWGPKCGGGAHCFYGTIGLAASTDGGETFEKMGQIIQPHTSRPDWIRGKELKSLSVGPGPMVMGDGAHRAIDPRRADAAKSYLYVYYVDHDPASECGDRQCLAVARARVADVVEAVLAGEKGAMPRLFRKYHKGAFEEPAATGDPDNAKPSGHYQPLMREFAGAALYDSTIDKVLFVNRETPASLALRASADLVDWSAPPIATMESARGFEVTNPGLVGDSDDASVGAGKPWLFYRRMKPDGFWRGSDVMARMMTLSKRD